MGTFHNSSKIMKLNLIPLIIGDVSKQHKDAAQGFSSQYKTIRLL